MTGVFTLAGRNMKEVYRDPVSIALGLLMPVGFVVLFTALGRAAPLEIFTVNMLTPGIAVFSFAFLMMFSAMLLSKDRQTAFLARLLTTPLRSSEFILAYVLPFLPLSLLQVAACYAVGAAWGFTLDGGAAATLLILFPMAVACIGLGMIIGSLFSENQVAGVGSIVITAAGIFGGAWMDLDAIGGVFGRIGYALPFAHAVRGCRILMQGGSPADTTGDLIWVCTYAVVLFVLGVAAFRWRTRR